MINEACAKEERDVVRAPCLYGTIAMIMLLIEDADTRNLGNTQKMRHPSLLTNLQFLAHPHVFMQD
jgi:hypothetical protein